ncbi:MAG: DUF3696 domain-containing protein [Planctomycetes bacterium]|nr:DUF3696 domain-containing protein [Planctomycetota bacterium]
MIKELRFKSFKSWRDTGPLALAPLTGLFGTNSSGKSSILQLLLMLKQTVESTDRKRVLHTGDDVSIVDLGTFSNLIYRHDLSLPLEVGLDWDLRSPLRIKDPEEKGDTTLFEVNELKFQVRIDGSGTPETPPFVRDFSYSFGQQTFGMALRGQGGRKYELISRGYQPKRQVGRPWPLPAPVKFYGFPDEVSGYFQNVGFLSEVVLELEGLFRRTAYLGPLRDYPKRIYTWAGDEPSDVGRKGELAVPATLAARAKGRYISPGYKRHRQTLEKRLAYWLKEMGIIESFSIQQIGQNRKDYEVLVSKTKQAPEVLITDVGFGLSQVLPVVVMCYYVEEGSVLLLEQPELHLHPLAQAWLADIFIDVVNNRNVQIIVESHSEHFLRRLQRRIAEEKIENNRTALYFCRIENSASRTERLDVNMFGDITNWPKDFFGDEMGELVAKTEAAMQRQTGPVL